mmetsp:Transcript_2558/g.8432  ORF Transcript_2558/g.8432 Transcript_2558/m.8432 type:complete len:97 (-) Transcript_2558:1714-2004(-)
MSERDRRKRWERSLQRGGKKKGGYGGCKEQIDEGVECQTYLGLKGYQDRCFLPLYLTPDTLDSSFCCSNFIIERIHQTLSFQLSALSSPLLASTQD